MKEIFVEANGLRFACLEAGGDVPDAPLVVFLHGFPDNAWTWEHQFGPFVAAGYRVVAPFLRGFPPTDIPVDGYYDGATLATDIAALIVAINGGKPCFLVGQDWGAAIGFIIAAHFPDLIRRAVMMAIPHPAAMAASLADPAQIKRAFHWWFFQLPGLPEQIVPQNNFAFIDFLWADWSPGFNHSAHIARVKATLAEPGALAAAIGYYRAAFNPDLRDPALAHRHAGLVGSIAVPTLALCGATDIRRGPMATQAEYFTADYAYAEIADASHFLHREKPDEVNALILDWLRAGTAD